MDTDFKKEVIDRSLEDIKTEFDEEFDRNFERKAFFDEKEWPKGNSTTVSVRSCSAPVDYVAASAAGSDGMNWSIPLPNPTPVFITRVERFGLPRR